THLLEALADAADVRRPDLLLALDDLRADVADVVLPRLPRWPATDRAIAVRLLAHARGRDVGPALMAWALQWVQPERRARRGPAGRRGAVRSRGRRSRGRCRMRSCCGRCAAIGRRTRRAS